MALRISAPLLLPALVIGPALCAQPVYYDSQAPQVSFVSAQMARALDRNGPRRTTASATSTPSQVPSGNPGTITDNGEGSVVGDTNFRK